MSRDTAVDGFEDLWDWQVYLFMLLYFILSQFLILVCIFTVILELMFKILLQVGEMDWPLMLLFINTGEYHFTN